MNSELERLAELHEKVRRLHSTPDERVDLDALMYGWLPALLAAARERDELRAWQREAADWLREFREARIGGLNIAPAIDRLLARVKP